MTSGTRVVERFFNALENGDIELAKNCMTASPMMIFPGGVKFASLDEMISAGQSRYRSIRKVDREYFDIADGNRQTVVVHGHLEGINLQGEAFSRVRFIDVFRLKEGQIAEQEVWNDLKECAVL